MLSIAVNSFKVVASINNKKILKLSDVVEALKHPLGDFHVITCDGGVKPIILEAALMEEANERLQQQYGIPSAIRLEKKRGDDHETE